MKRIFIDKIETEINPLSNSVEVTTIFSPDIVRIATVNSEFREFLRDFYHIWEPRIRSTLTEIAQSLYDDYTNHYALSFGNATDTINSYLKIKAEMIADEMDTALANKFQQTNFFTISLVEEAVTVKYYRFMDDHSHDCMYLPYSALTSKWSMLGDVNFGTLRKRNVRI